MLSLKNERWKWAGKFNLNILRKKPHIPYDENCCDSNNSVCVAVMVALCCEMWNIHLGNVAHHGPGSDPALAWE